MGSISLQFSAAGSASWVTVSDVALTGLLWAAGTSSAAAVSYDEAVSIGSIRTPSASGTDRNLIATATQGNPTTIFPDAFPVPAGQPVFVSASAAGTATIFYRLP